MLWTTSHRGGLVFGSWPIEAETSTAIELRCMREVVKKANLGVKQHGLMHARLGRRLGVER